MLTKDPNKVGYSGLETPDDVEPTKRIVFSAEQYVEAFIVADIPEGYTDDDIDWGYLDYDVEGKPIAVITMTNGKEFELGPLSDFSSDDRPRVRITDEEWVDEYYDSWS